jgi:predicted ester cyclase
MNASLQGLHTKVMDTVQRSMPNSEANRLNVIAIRYYKRHFSDDVVVTLVGTDQSAQGPEDAEAWIDYLHTEAFETRPELKSMIVADGQAAAEFDFVGEHVGEFRGIAATGRGVRVPYSVVYDLQVEKSGGVRARY